MQTNVELYFTQGCLRCKYGATPQCKVLLWTDILYGLRNLLSETNLTEEIKWGAPCYTINGKNVLMIAAFKEYCAISFFKGALMNDDFKLLARQGENSNIARIIKFTKFEDLIDKKTQVLNYIQQSINIELEDKKILPNQKQELVLVNELAEIFKENEPFKNAFYKLTVGKQRGYNIYFSQAKQSTTRLERIHKNMQKIMEGKGFFD